MLFKTGYPNLFRGCDFQLDQLSNELEKDLYFSWMVCWLIAGLSPNNKFTGTHLYTRVERGTVRVKCLAQEPRRNEIPTQAPLPLMSH